ncbi:glycosyltransferase family 4 protein [Maribacter sp. 2210JD10-5]|uniref:glycosyltransferase family 4 protein n=1 Tax=Maribacter sp. 2210JD10-5 TaxID=3386272 RepID=UPI0039BC33AC
MKKVAFIALKYSSITSEPNLYTDLMSTFFENGHEAFVVAPTLEENDEISLNIEAGVNVLRVPTLRLFGNGLIKKGISNILLPYQYKRALKKMKIQIDFDLIIIPTPPITLISVALWMKKRSNAKLYLVLRDIFPQNGVDLELISKTGPAYRYFRKLEKKLYKKSDFIGCMSPGNVNYIKRHNPYMDFSKLHLLPNWEGLDTNERDESVTIELQERYNISNKVVALYGGNIGMPQQMENIIHLAESVQHLEDLAFLIIGWGSEKERIIAMAKEKKLKNMIFVDSVTRIEFSDILKIADIGLVSLNENFTIPNYPSKVNAYYKFKIPVLAAVDKNTDFGVEQEKIGCGFWSVSGDTKTFTENLLRLYENETLRKEMGQKGYEYMINNLTPKHAYERIIAQLN